LLKNTIVEGLGIQAYAAFSQACINAMAIEPEVLGMIRHAETYDHVGEVSVWVHDLERRWQEEDSRERVIVTAGDAMLALDFEVAAPPQVVWEFITTPGRRTNWQHGVTDFVQSNKTGGRRGRGMVNHCMHGPDAIIEEILDWRPFDYLTDRSTMPGGAPTFLSTFELEPTPTGTHVYVRFAAPRSAKERAMLEAIGVELGPVLEAGFRSLAEQAESEAAVRSEGRELEPGLPVPRPDGLFSEIRPLLIVG
jgi:uncharacterized protein YndB with AHSA1/START domain